MKGKRRRLWEGSKTLLIVLLSCSAVFLASRALFPRQGMGFFTRSAQGDATTDAVQTFSAQTIRPAAFAVTWDAGRYGLLYHQEDQEGYTQISALLAEALSGAGQPVQTDRAAWLRALSDPGVFCEYLGPVPLDALTRWLSGQESAALAGAQARQLCVTSDALLFRDGADKLWSCALETDLTDALAALFPHFSPNGARFAGEDSEYRHLRPDALVLPLTPSLPQLAADDPVTPTDPAVPGEALSQMLQTLSFHPQTNPLYDITGGWAITDSGETLRIGAGGRFTYRRSDDAQVRFPAQDPVDATRALAEKTVGAVCGDARLYLMEVKPEGAAIAVTYGYAYRGAAIVVDDEDGCARFTVENGAVDSFVLKPRHYTALADAQSVLLPQELAAAALSGVGEQALTMLYDDAGAQTLVPFWAVRDRGR